MRMLSVRYVPALTIELYRESTKSNASGVEAETTFTILSSLCSLSPGFMRSGAVANGKNHHLALNARTVRVQEHIHLR